MCRAGTTQESNENVRVKLSLYLSNYHTMKMHLVLA
jgi:hypothetical protein